MLKSVSVQHSDDEKLLHYRHKILQN